MVRQLRGQPIVGVVWCPTPPQSCWSGPGSENGGMGNNGNKRGGGTGGQGGTGAQRVAWPGRGLPQRDDVLGELEGAEDLAVRGARLPQAAVGPRHHRHAAAAREEGAAGCPQDHGGGVLTPPKCGRKCVWTLPQGLLGGGWQEGLLSKRGRDPTGAFVNQTGSPNASTCRPSRERERDPAGREN